jgi:hypothetical protein
MDDLLATLLHVTNLGVDRATLTESELVASVVV